MGFVEGIGSEVRHLVEDPAGGLLRDPVSDAARYPLLGVSVNEVLPLLLHHLRLFLGHGSPHQVRPAQAVACQLLDDLHYLLLVNDTAVGGLQDRLQLRALIGHGVPVVLSLDIPGDEVHGARTVKGKARNNIVDGFRLKLLHEAGHAGRLQLEHACRIPPGDHLVDLRVSVIDPVDIDMDAVIPFRLDLGVFDHRKGPEAQEVHLQEPQLLQGRHGILGHHGAVLVSGQGHVLVYVGPGDQHPCGMHAGMPRQALKPQGHVDEISDLRILGIGLFQIRA